MTTQQHQRGLCTDVTTGITARQQPSSLVSGSSRLHFYRMTMSLFVAIFISVQQHNVQAYPTGAGSCIAGEAPVGGFHLEPNDPTTGDKRTILFGALSEGSVSVLVNNNADNPVLENTPYVLQTQTAYTITVVTTQDPGFKGILIRFGSTETSINALDDIILEPDSTLLDFAEACLDEDNAIGLTHTDNSQKLSVTAGMTFNKPGTIYLDVSIVGVNDAVSSIYGHTGFILQIEGDAKTDAPTTAPTRAPIVVLPPGNTAAPSITPTLNDFLVDTLSPTYSTEKPAGASSPSSTLLSTTTTSNAMATRKSLLCTFTTTAVVFLVALTHTLRI